MEPDLDRLIRQLHAARTEQVEAAITALVASGAPAIAPLLEALRGQDRRSRKHDTSFSQYIALTLSRIGGAAVLPLRMATRDEDTHVRYCALIALEGIRDPAAVEPLCLALQDEDYLVRFNAILALGHIRDARAVPALCEILRRIPSDYVQRLVAAHSLGQIGDVAAVGPLLAALHDPHREVAYNAAEAIAKIGNPVMLPRKVVAAATLSIPQRLEILRTLRKAQYHWPLLVSLRYSLPELPFYCERLLHDEDTAVRAGAKELLEELDRSTLLRATQRDRLTERQALLRAAATAPVRLRPEEMVRPATPGPLPPTATRKRHEGWRRLFRSLE